MRKLFTCIILLHALITAAILAARFAGSRTLPVLISLIYLVIQKIE